jgi:acyl-coenzyme A synthetase/AMP-(fatty) acid ligase
MDCFRGLLIYIGIDGEKVVPGPIESALLAHPRVAGAVMFGRERNQTGILIEPADNVDLTDSAARARFADDIWYAVACIVQRAHG